MEEREYLRNNSSKAVKITLTDESFVVLPPYSYGFIDTADKFILGGGVLSGASKWNPVEFHGLMRQLRIDTVKFTNETIQGRVQVHYYELWLSDTLRVRCQPGGFRSVSVDTSTTLWYVGKKRSIKQGPFKVRGEYSFGSIREDEIQSVETQKFSVVKTIGWTLLLGGVVAVLAVGAIEREVNKTEFRFP